MTNNRSFNAISHGLYVRDPILPWEDAKDYAAYTEGIRGELMPDGPLEEETVREIADLHWRKRRLVFHWQLQCQDKVPSAELMAAAKAGHHRFLEYYRETKKTVPEKGISTKLAEFIEKTKTTLGASEKAADESQAKELDETKEPNPNAASDRDIIARSYSSVSLETQLKQESMIDARIAKALARLAHLKEYKRMYSQKVVLELAPLPPPLLPPPVSVNGTITEPKPEPAVQDVTNAANPRTRNPRDEWIVRDK